MKIKELTNAPQWLIDAVVENEDVEIDSEGRVQWRKGQWFRGDFRGGDFRGGDFRGGDFWGGNFRGGNFWGGNFWGGDFWGGNFWGGDFRGGDFRGGDFWGGDFRGGDFWGVKAKAFRLVGRSPSRGYDFFVVSTVDDGIRVFAGCRNFSLEEARSHWADNKIALLFCDTAEAIAASLDWVQS